MISIVGEITGESLVVEATASIKGGFRRRIQAEKTLDGGAVVIDFGEDIAGMELVIEAVEVESAETLEAMDRICRENNQICISSQLGVLVAVPKSSENGIMNIVIKERRE